MWSITPPSAYNLSYTPILRHRTIINNTKEFLNIVVGKTGGKQIKNPIFPKRN